MDMGAEFLSEGLYGVGVGVKAGVKPLEILLDGRIHG